MRPVLASALLVLAACGDTSGELETGGEDVPTTAAPAEEVVTLTCGEGLPFESSALAGPTGAEESEGDANDLLRAVLAEPSMGGEPLPATGWRTLVANEYGTLFGAGDAPDLSIVQIWVEEDGLDTGPSGGCRPRPYREGFAVGRWSWPAPTGRRTAPSSSWPCTRSTVRASLSPTTGCRHPR